MRLRRRTRKRALRPRRPVRRRSLKSDPGRASLLSRPRSSRGVKIGRVSLWLLLVIGVAPGFALPGVGVQLVKPAGREKGPPPDVGVPVITTTVIPPAIFVLQILDENRLQRQDET